MRSKGCLFHSFHWQQYSGPGPHRETAENNKFRPVGRRPTGRNRKCYALDLHGIIHIDRRFSPPLGTGFFWQYIACLNLSKRSLLHGGSLRGPPIPPASGRRSVWGQRVRRPWCVQSRRVLVRHGKRAAARRLFFFAVVRQDLWYLYSVIILRPNSRRNLTGKRILTKYTPWNLTSLWHFKFSEW